MFILNALFIENETSFKSFSLLNFIKNHLVPLMFIELPLFEKSNIVIPRD